LQRKFNHSDRVLTSTFKHIIKRNFKHTIKRNFKHAIATCAALMSGTFGIVAANAEDGRSHSQSGIASVYSTESGHSTASGQHLNPGL